LAVVIRISSELREALLAQADERPGEEVCGLLFGNDEEIVAIQSARNIAASPHDSFEIDPTALIAAHRAMREGGARLIGCYHSHPNGVCEPSVRDAAAATQIGWLWLIIGGGKSGLRRATGDGFVAIPLC
jgi:proteasome lid subunit RPN8/RPN11